MKPLPLLLASQNKYLPLPQILLLLTAEKPPRQSPLLHHYGKGEKKCIYYKKSYNEVVQKMNEFVERHFYTTTPTRDMLVVRSSCFYFYFSKLLIDS